MNMALARPSGRAFVPAASSPCGSRPKASIPRGEQGFARLAAFEAAKQEIRARFYEQWQRVNADMAAELGELDRRFWAGEAL